MTERPHPAAGKGAPQVSPPIPELLQRGFREHQAGHLDQARHLYLQILSLDAHHPDSLHLLGLAEYQSGHLESAEKMVRRAIAVAPRAAVYHSTLGSVLHTLGNHTAAAASFEQALALDPGHIEARFNLGNVLLEQGRLDEAEAAFKTALAARPDYIEALHNLGKLHRDQGRWKDAEACYLRVLALLPENTATLSNMGSLLLDQGRLAEARAFLERAVILKPDFAEALSSLGAVLQDQGALDEAMVCYQRSVALDPDAASARWNLALLQLLRGDFTAGWANFESRHRIRREAPRGFPQPLWRGEPLAGVRILIHAEQGLGDNLQFLRYVPMVAAMAHAAGGSVILDVPVRLRRLAAGLSGIIQVVSSGDPLPPFDCHCPLMSLPTVFATTLETIPAQVPYLSIPPEAARTAAGLEWAARGLRVGLAWAGNPRYLKDRYRSMTLSQLAPLFQVEGVSFYSLQMGPQQLGHGSEQLPSFLAGSRAPIADLAPVTGDMADTAAQMVHLDFVITTDTSVAHMAGALARPTWVMLAHTPDWRWLLERDDSPWYPTMRLFRQPSPGDWNSVVARVGDQLAKAGASFERSREPALSSIPVRRQP
jgi:Tfp pilus assembly protein PilF